MKSRRRSGLNTRSPNPDIRNNSPPVTPARSSRPLTRRFMSAVALGG